MKAITKADRKSASNLIAQVLKETGRPMTAQAIFKGVQAKGYRWRSRDPLGALINRLISDRAFRRVRPGTFELK